ncbi:hypothetical protein TSUD_75920 [Trifolium subterraneum]|nr:hypothetical protein TSUD_75920 [Trifolium subterraneum]
MLTGSDFSLICICLYHAEQQHSSKPCLRQDAGMNSHFSVIEEINSNKTVVKPSREGQPSSRPYLLQDAGLGSHIAVIEEIKSNKTVPVVKPLRDGQPPSRPCLRQDTDLNSQFAGIEAIKSNKTVPVVKPLRDANQILFFLQDPKPHDCYVKGGRSSNRSYQNIVDRESTEAILVAPLTLLNLGSAAACDGGSFQFRENVKMSNQPYSDKKAQENIDEANFDLLLSSPDDHSSCPISNEGETAEEFSHEREAFPSFDLGF